MNGINSHATYQKPLGESESSRSQATSTEVKTADVGNSVLNGKPQLDPTNPTGIQETLTKIAKEAKPFELTYSKLSNLKEKILKAFDRCFNTQFSLKAKAKEQVRSLINEIVDQVGDKAVYHLSELKDHLERQLKKPLLPPPRLDQVLIAKVSEHKNEAVGAVGHDIKNVLSQYDELKNTQANRKQNSPREPGESESLPVPTDQYIVNKLQSAVDKINDELEKELEKGESNFINSMEKDSNLRRAYRNNWNIEDVHTISKLVKEISKDPKIPDSQQAICKSLVDILDNILNLKSPQ